MKFDVLHPALDYQGSENDRSCVLRISTRGGSVLLTGDIERRAERALTAGNEIDVDVVIVPHHGSATSSTAAFVAATSPRYAIVSSGFGNRWNFPRPEVVERWCAVGSIVLVTGEHGAIEVELSGSEVRVAALRSSRPRYWRDNGAARCGESTTLTL